MSRLALVVGGASGIGAACAVALADGGHRVAIADIADAAHVAAQLPGEGHAGHQVDVTDESSVTKLFDAVEARSPVAVLVHCAAVGGFLDGRRPSLAETSLAVWDRVLTTNATGAFLCTREMLRRRAAAPVADGRVILIGSMAAEDGGKNSPPAYVASKGAVHALVKAVMAEAAAAGLTVNCVAPGAIDTPFLRRVLPAERHRDTFAQTPLGRVGLPAEVAAAVTFLASPAAAFITGSRLDVNGGIRMA